MIKDGAREIKIHGEIIPVRAQIRSMDSFSSHADSTEILKWLGKFNKAPKLTFVVHGEENSSIALADEIHRSLGWKTHVPQYLESFDLR